MKRAVKQLASKPTSPGGLVVCWPMILATNGANLSGMGFPWMLVIISHSTELARSGLYRSSLFLGLGCQMLVSLVSLCFIYTIWVSPHSPHPVDPVELRETSPWPPPQNRAQRRRGDCAMPGSGGAGGEAAGDACFRESIGGAPKIAWFITRAS